MTQVLVVEDDETTQFMMTEFLETLGYKCHVVESGEACLARLRETGGRYDVVLLDLHMPGMSGLAAAQAIRTAPETMVRSIPIVAVTGDTGFHNHATISDYGLNDVLPKPIDLSALDLTIQKHAS